MPYREDGFYIDSTKSESEPRKVSEKTRLKQEAKFLRNQIRKARALLHARATVASLRDMLDSLSDQAHVKPRF